MPPLPRLPAAAFLRRTLLRGVFVALLLGSGLLVLQLLTDERQRLQRDYEAGFQGRLDVIAERLRHPSGQLALLNLDRPPPDGHGSVPLRLPLGAIDFDDPARAERALELTACGDWCPAVGQRASAGAFVYAMLRLPLGALVGREPGQLDLDEVHRVAVTLTHAGQRRRWLAPLELLTPTRGQLAGFATDADALERLARPDREFRGWLWQPGAQPAVPSAAGAGATERSLLSLRIPVDGWREAARSGASWPPADLTNLRLHLRLLGPGGAVLFDSAAAAPEPAPSDRAELQPGETLELRRGQALLATWRGREAQAEAAFPWLTRLIRRLPAARLEGPLRALARLPGGEELVLRGELSQLDRRLAGTATRYSAYFAALAGAIALAWLIVELGLLRRMALLTRRANALKTQLQAAPDQLPPLDVADLRGADELGILAGTLSELLGRAREHLRSEQLRAHQEREQWQAVGHEIMSPLQSLLALHAKEGDASRRYLQRMQAAMQLLYGHASVSEAVAQASAERARLDLAAFVRDVATGAPYAGIDDVQAIGCDRPCEALADALKLEDALTHLLVNAQRYRRRGTPITLELKATPEQASIAVRNQGPQIAPQRLATLFELGTSDHADPTRRGQGLFVARGYLAKMGGAITVANQADGVCFTLTLPR